MARIPGNDGIAERGKRHPLKWRGLSWVIIDVDALLLGFGVGAVVAYNFLARWSQDAQEGIGIFVFLITAATLAATAVLGIWWVVSGVIAKRRPPQERPVRRLVWVSPIITFASGLAIGGGSWLQWYGVR